MRAAAIEPATMVVDAARFATMVGVPEPELPAPCRAVLDGGMLRGERLTGPAREAELLRALRASEDQALVAAGPHRAGDWERGWHENLREFRAGDGSLQALMPKYNRHHVLRFAGEYLRVADPAFEYTFYTALRHACFGRWFRGLERVVEFGCGTGTSLALLADTFPALELWGLDWAPSSQQILAQLGQRLGREVHGRRFDMFAPDATFRLAPGTGVLTSAAMEQLGGDHGRFVDHLLAQQPAVCLHIEPIVELYESNTLFDEVASRYHHHRNYLTGFLPRLHELAAQGRIELLHAHRTGFGSFHHEGYSIVCWRPRIGGEPRP